jgi:hypothetical protein
MPSWEACKDPATMDDLRQRVALCVDVSPDRFTPRSTPLPSRRTAEHGSRSSRHGTVKTARQLRRELPGSRQEGQASRPRMVPEGTCGGYRRRPREAWRHPSSRHEGGGHHGRTPPPCVWPSRAGVLLARSPTPTSPSERSGRWRRAPEARRPVAFTRSGSGHVDALYAAAGAVHLARTIPSIGKPRIVTARDI